jgi:hypothetical protein
VAKDPTPMNHLEWAVPARGRVQTTMLELHKLGGHNPIKQFGNGSLAAIYNLLVGASFSLWRASFLADVPEDPEFVRETSLAHAAKFLNKVLTDNTFTFAHDQVTNAWTFGYYLNNARFRLTDACQRLKTAGVAIGEDGLTGLDVPTITAQKTWEKMADVLEHLADAIPNLLPLK